jgi:NADH-quinone oxidoreductase subunit K
MTIGLGHYLALSSALFCIGLVGVLTRRNALLVLLSIELILNAANLSFVAFSSQWGDVSGQVVVFFAMIVAAAEVTVGLAVVVICFRKNRTTDIEKLDSLKW